MFRSKRARVGAGAVAVAMHGGGDRRMRVELVVVVVERGIVERAGGCRRVVEHLDFSASSSGGSGTRMAIFYYNPSPYGVASLKGAQPEAQKLGIKLDAFDANNDPQMQSTQIQDAITTGKYKAFWVWGLNDVALTPIINKALAAGIKVAAADYTWGPLSDQNILTADPQIRHHRRPVDRSGVDEPDRRDELGLPEAGGKRPLQHRLPAGACQLPDRHRP